MERTIELDCPPGYTRPGDLIAGVIKDTGLPTKEPRSKLFGNWIWDYEDDISDDKWSEIRPILGSRIRDLHDKGYIRYGSW